MDHWLRVPSRVLLVELAVVGLIIGSLFFVFLWTPQPAWLPALVLWGVTIGFVVYRIVAGGSRRVRSATTRQIAAARPRSVRVDESAAERERAYAATMAADVGWQESVPQDVFDDPWSASSGDDLRATLFDVPSVGATGDAFRKLEVFTDEDLANAQADTMMLDSVAQPDADAGSSDLAGTPIEIPAVEDEWGEGAGRTLDEETWQRLLADGGDGRRSHDH